MQNIKIQHYFKPTWSGYYIDIYIQAKVMLWIDTKSVEFKDCIDN